MKRLSRADLEADGIRQAMGATALARQLLSEQQMEASLAAALAARPGPGDVWLFAYGSLIWNPALRVAERRIARLNGYHRRFCLVSRVNRGTPEKPGLALGLDRGGACTGVAYRIAAEDAQAELRLLWRREMLVGAYTPRWVRVRCGDDCTAALAFVMDRGGPSYAGRLPDPEVVRILREACGLYGSGAEYLRETVSALQGLGVRDRYLRRLLQLLDRG